MERRLLAFSALTLTLLSLPAFAGPAPVQAHAPASAPVSAQASAPVSAQASAPVSSAPAPVQIPASAQAPASASASPSPSQGKKKPASIDELFTILTKAESADSPQNAMLTGKKNLTFKVAAGARKNFAARQYVESQLFAMGAKIIPRLINGLNDERVPVSRMCAVVLGKFGEPAVNPLLQAVRAHKVSLALAMMTLQMVGPAALPSQVALLGKASNQDRMLILNSIVGAFSGQALSKPAMELSEKQCAPLFAAAEDKTPEVCLLGLTALSRVRPTDAKVVRLVERAQQSSRDVSSRTQLISALGLLASREAGTQAHATAQYLVEILQHDKNVEVRRAAAQALADVRSASDVVAPALGIAINDSDPGVRDTATQSLTKLGPAACAAIPQLVKRLDDPHSPTTLATIATITAMGKAGAPALPALIKLCDKTKSSEKDVSVRSMIGVAFAGLGTQALPAVPQLVNLLQDDNLHIQFAAMQTLSKMGPMASSAIQPLEDVVARNQKAAPAAKYALKRIRGI